MQRLDGQSDSLATADAERDDAAAQAVAPHRMDKPRREDRPCRADRVAVSDGAAFDIDDILRQPQFSGHDDGNGGEGLVDLDTLDGPYVPAGALQR